MTGTASNKTQATSASVQDFLRAVEDDGRRQDAVQLCLLMQQVTGEPPVMWGPSIVGFGQYHYKYDSGREGDMAAAGFSPRASNLTIYLANGTGSYPTLLRELGPHKTGKACLYIKRLADVDLTVLEKLIRASYRYVMSNKDEMHRAE